MDIQFPKIDTGNSVINPPLQTNPNTLSPINNNNNKLDNNKQQTSIEHSIFDPSNINISIHPSEMNKLNKSQVEHEINVQNKLASLNEYIPMEQPWKSHLDSMAKMLVKTKKRVRAKVEVKLETDESKDKLLKSSASTKSFVRTGVDNKTKKGTINSEIKNIKEEKEIIVTQVEKHTKPKSDSMIDTIRKEKELERKQKIQQLLRLKEIQEEEDVQRKQMKKLQAEMKSKPFVYDNKGNLIFVQKNQKFAKNMLDVQYNLTDVKLSARGGSDVSFTIDKETEKKQQFTATNVQPSSMETIKLAQGVTILSKGSKVEGPRPEFETYSKNE